MDKIKIGVLGAGRGRMMIKYCALAGNAELVAVCDSYEPFLNRVKEQLGAQLDGDKVTFYTDFEEFIKHDMDAVILSNYANDHAPFAIRCLKAGKHVFSECLPCANMKEAVELVEAVESSDKLYAFSENYCYFPATMEMRKLYREGKLGEFEYGEGEYIHNCEPVWPEITQGNPDHWRNNLYSTYYCTHGTGPLIHITGLRPVRVTGFETPYNARNLRMGSKAGGYSILMMEMENGSYMKVAQGMGPSRDSVWYSLYGSKGRIESARDDTREYEPEPGMGSGVCQIYTNLDEYEGESAIYNAKTYEPKDDFSEKAGGYGHSGSDYYDMWNFVEKLRGNPDADVIDVYEALDMGLPGILGYESIMKGSIPVEIPNFRFAAERERYRCDTGCTDPAKAGDMLWPCYHKGNPEIDPQVYEKAKQIWLECEPDSLAQFFEEEGKKTKYGEKKKKD